MSNKSSIKVLSDSGKMLHGTAAQLKYVSDQGGWDKYHEKLAAKITNTVIKEMVKEQRKATYKVAK